MSGVITYLGRDGRPTKGKTNCYAEQREDLEVWYSYAVIIAFVNVPTNEAFVRSCKGFSNTTGRHIYAVRNYLSGIQPVEDIRDEDFWRFMADYGVLDRFDYWNGTSYDPPAI